MKTPSADGRALKRAWWLALFAILAVVVRFGPGGLRVWEEISAGRPDPVSAAVPVMAGDSAVGDFTESAAIPAAAGGPAEDATVEPGSAGTGETGWNRGDRPGRPLDRLEITATVAAEWPGGFPARPGWHPRVRIVETTFKSGLVRIEEQVEVEIVGGNVRHLRSVIEKAVDARHLLVSSRHAGALERQGIAFMGGRNPHFVRVPVDEPRLISSLPKLAAHLAKLSLDGAEPDSLIGASALPADPLVGSGAAWHLDNLGLLPGHRPGADLGAAAAWDRRTDSSGVLVAVIDSGIASSDPELAGSIWLMPGETIGDGLDSDGNGYVDDVFGYDFYHDDADPEDESGHGSACAALMAAAGNNGVGSAGVAWKGSILNCKFLGPHGLGTLSDAIDAIDYARAAQAKILNMSWSYAGDAPLLTEALARCDAEGILMVCASGNMGGLAALPAPASIDLPHLIAVASSTPADTLASFSSVDPERVAVAAPGVDLPVALAARPWNPTGRVLYVSGTSYSAAITSGALALARAEFPGETALVTLRRLLETVDPLPGGAAALASGGRLNLRRMLASSGASVPHDFFEERRILTDSTGRWTGRNEGAGTEAVDLALGLVPTPERTIWFEWKAPSDGLLRVDAQPAAGAGAARLSVFSDINDLPGALLATADDGETLEIDVLAGQRLFWMLDSAGPGGGGLILRWHLPPPNDNWADATELEGMPLTVSGNSLGATVETFEEGRPHHEFLPQGSVWWKWTSGFNGTVKATASDDHAVFILPLDAAGRPAFPLNYEMTQLYQDHRPVLAGQRYAMLAIPMSPAAAGSFTLAITGPDEIAILVHPSDVAALPGESVELGVQVAATSGVVFQWSKNGEAIPFARQPTLKLSPVTDATFASYHVTASNGGNVLQSHPAVVSLRHERPRLIAATPRRTVVSGQTVDLRATFSSATEMAYTWRRNAEPIGGTGPSLLIPAATPADSGTYLLTATNAVGPSVATFQVNVVETPWNGWVDRSPAGTGTGAILRVSLDGNFAGALTATEWLSSTDGGESWASVPMPANVRATTGAARPEGSLLVAGINLFESTYGEAELWRHETAAGWTKLSPLITLPDASTVSSFTIRELTFFDGKWWAVAGWDHTSVAVHSADGIGWTPLPDASRHDGLMSVERMFRFENRLSIAHWRDHSGQRILLLSPGGGSQMLNFTGDVRQILRIDGVSYTPFRFPAVEKITDGQSSPVEVPGAGNLHFGDFAEGFRHGPYFSALVDMGPGVGSNPGGSLMTGIHEKTQTTRLIGFSAHAKSGNRWLVGYPDGRLWTGTDLQEMPVMPKNRQTMNAQLRAFQDEFLFGAYHSSDGSDWQLLGAATTNPNRAQPLAQAGDLFLHAIRSPLINQPLMAASVFPSTLGEPHLTVWPDTYASGSTGILRWRNNTSVKFAELVRNEPSGVTMTEIDFGVKWSSLDKAAEQINGRWFVKGMKPVLFPRIPRPFSSRRAMAFLGKTRLCRPRARSVRGRACFLPLRTHRAASSPQMASAGLPSLPKVCRGAGRVIRRRSPPASPPTAATSSPNTTTACMPARMASCGRSPRHRSPFPTLPPTATACWP